MMSLRSVSGMLLAALISSVSFFSSPIMAAESQEEKSEEAKGPASVDVGLYLVQIPSIDLKNNQFTAMFWIWFRWTDPDINPLETFEVVGAQITKDGASTEELDGGVHYGVVRVVATVPKFFDISRFPLDSHVFTIRIEDNESEDHKLRYVADVQNSKMESSINVPGWVIKRSEALVQPHLYSTNYGDISLPAGNASSYSAFDFSIYAERPGISYFFKLLWGTFIAFFVAMLSFFIRPIDLDPRFGLGVGAIFAAMANNYVISSSLPDTQIMTIADVVGAASIFFIFLSIALSAISLGIWNSRGESATRKFDRICFVTLLAAYLIINVMALRAW